MKHTKGPWESFICDDGGEWSGWPLCVTQANDDDKVIVRTGGQWPYKWDASTSQVEAVANARLIAAAPDLLEALQGLLADIQDYQRINNLGGENNHWQVISRAAIAKATQS